MEKKVKKLKAGDMIYPSAFGLILPFGLASALVLVVEVLGIFVFFLGLLKSPESVIESFTEGNPFLYTILGGYALFGGLQVLVRVMLAKTRIVVGVDTIQRRGVFSTHEISTSLVEQITKYQRFFFTDLHLSYHPLSKTRKAKIDGWLFSKADMTRVALYIGEKNIKL